MRLICVPGRESEVVCTVRKGRLTCTVDDQKIIDWQGDFSRLSVPASLAKQDPKSLYLLTLSTSYEISRISFTPLGRE